MTTLSCVEVRTVAKLQAKLSKEVGETSERKYCGLCEALEPGGNPYTEILPPLAAWHGRFALLAGRPVETVTQANKCDNVPRVCSVGGSHRTCLAPTQSPPQDRPATVVPSSADWIS